MMICIEEDHLAETGQKIEDNSRVDTEAQEILSPLIDQDTSTHLILTLTRPSTITEDALRARGCAKEIVDTMGP